MKKIFSSMIISFSLVLSNVSNIFANGYGHVPVKTDFVLDFKTVSALIALVSFGIGATLIIEGKYFKSLSK
ncbi:hypothetical protein K8R20_01320 [bacterium]|nr:hypothetical protein [bacterium]